MFQNSNHSVVIPNLLDLNIHNNKSPSQIKIPFEKWSSCFGSSSSSLCRCEFSSSRDLFDQRLYSGSLLAVDPEWDEPEPLHRSAGETIANKFLEAGLNMQASLSRAQSLARTVHVEPLD